MMKLALHQREIFSPFTHRINLFWIRHILWDSVIELNRVGIFVVRSVIWKKGLEERKLLRVGFIQYTDFPFDIFASHFFGSPYLRATVRPWVSFLSVQRAS